MNPGEQKIKEMADRLISTLDTLMPSDQADGIVRDVALEMYAVLGIKGKLVQTSSGFIHGGFGKNGKKSMIPLATYEFKPEEATQ